MAPVGRWREEKGSESIGRIIGPPSQVWGASSCPALWDDFAAVLAAVASTPQGISLQPLLTDQASVKVLKGKSNEEPPGADLGGVHANS